MLAVSIESVTTDIREMVTTGKYPVVMLLRGYGLLELLEDHFSSRCGDCEVIGNALSEYKRVYEEYGEKLEEMLDREIIKSKAEAYMRPWQRKLDEAQKAYKKSVELWKVALWRGGALSRQCGDWPDSGLKGDVPVILWRARRSLCTRLKWRQERLNCSFMNIMWNINAILPYIGKYMI